LNYKFIGYQFSQSGDPDGDPRRREHPKTSRTPKYPDIQILPDEEARQIPGLVRARIDGYLAFLGR
jgi:hypothetical protein